MTLDQFEIVGGQPLKGSITPQGAKNEVLEILCATLLTEEPVLVRNIPDIKDVNALIDTLDFLGVKTDRIDAHTCRFQADAVNLDQLYTEEARQRIGKLRGSVMLMGPLLARFGQAYMPRPGGDKIGRRPLDTHFLGIQKLGVNFSYSKEENAFSLHTSKLTGTYIWMTEVSVTGTANVLMTAVLAEGTTTIYNAACEPYTQQLCRMLNKMGAQISGIGSNLLLIEGVERLGGCEHTVLSDMLEVGSFIGLAAITQSEITIKNAQVKELGIIPDTFKRLGIQLEIQGDDIYLPPQDSYEIQKRLDGSIPTIYDAPWPGFTPDLLSIVLVTAIQAKGSLLVHQKMFESRLFFVDRLIDMGAQIILCDPHRAVVIGMNRQTALRGIRMSSPDIRAGIALLIAALSAEGTSIISNIHQIDRGYENIDGRLQKLGAKIRRL